MGQETKRFRIIAGPNGSGKSSVYRELLKSGHPNFGIYINADDIELVLKTKGILSLQDYLISATDDEIKGALLLFKDTRETKVNNEDFLVQDNFLVIKNKSSVDSYFAQFISEFVRSKMIANGVKTITIETVMSHPSKLDVMRYARKMGYRIYLYFITTDDPKINIERVKVRIKKGGHDVPEDRIIDRYKKALDNLYDATKLSDRAFFIDNSGQGHELLAEYNRAINSIDIFAEEIPSWIQKYFLNKNN